MLRSERRPAGQVGAARSRRGRQAVGIKINIKIETEDALNAQIYHEHQLQEAGRRGKYEPTYDAFMWGWGGDIATPDYNFEVLTCGNSSADAHVVQPQVHEAHAPRR